MSDLDAIACLLAAASDATDRQLRALYLATARAKLACQLQRMTELQALLSALEGELARTAGPTP